ncbi:T9SS type A sorting domain-containing protein [candidate division KSB1 bacterium]|nr:T9SS type A sorting domain-containing protein [candidate division KSB1 bacterium]
MEQNYPNPFNPGTTFDFTIPHDEFVSLKIYNLLGEEVAVVVKENLAAGRYNRKWSPAGLPSGIYFYRFQAGAFVQTRKLGVFK